MSSVGVDTGGTFTDVVARHDDGRIFVHKLLSTPDDPSRAIADGVEALDVHRASIVHGTTVATNALLQRQGCRVTFVTTAGFEDLLLLRRQNRPDLYSLHVELAPPLTEDTVGVVERVAADGHVVEALRSEEVKRVVAVLGAADTDAVAICLLHAYANDTHECMLAEAISDARPDLHVTTSSSLVREFREYERASTTVVNAYVGPVMSRYIENLAGRLPEASIEILQSSGGRTTLRDAATAPVHTVLSGPAGGVVGAFAAAQQLGLERIITFDMGGTSTDVSLCDGEPQLVYDASIADLPLRIPTLDIVTVGAGGGSLAWVDPGRALRVGPQSAGADPGPAAYGRGGQRATVTDAHVFLGSLRPEEFLGGEMALDLQASRAAIVRLATQLELDPAETARGILAIADATMVRAIKVICARHGHDPRDFALVAFGGAGGLHACRLAELLQIETVVVPENPGLLSAHGMLHAPRTRLFSEAIVAPLTDEALRRAADALRVRAADAEGVFQFGAALRYRGQSFELELAVKQGEQAAAGLRLAFDAAHEARFGYADTERDVELVTMRLTTTEGRPPSPPADLHRGPVRTRSTRHPVDLGLGTEPTAVAHRDDVRAAEGPMVITDYSGTTIVPPGWQVQNRGALILQRMR